MVPGQAGTGALQGRGQGVRQATGTLLLAPNSSLCLLDSAVRVSEESHTR